MAIDPYKALAFQQNNRTWNGKNPLSSTANFEAVPTALKVPEGVAGGAAPEASKATKATKAGPSKQRTSAPEPKAEPLPEDPRQAEFDYWMNPLSWLNPELMMTPEEAGLNELYADQGSVDAQYDAMNNLFNVWNQGGATAQDRARMAQIRGDQEQWLRGQNEANLQNMSERGMLGSGAELLTALANHGMAADRIYQNDLDTEAMHEERAMQALLDGSNLAGDIRKSSFDEGSTRADLISGVADFNKSYVQSAREKMMDRGLRWDETKLNAGVQAGQSLSGQDQKDDSTKYDYADKQNTTDTSSKNTASDTSRDVALGDWAEQEQAGAAGAAGAVQGAKQGTINAGVGIANSLGQLGEGAMGAYSAVGRNPVSGIFSEDEVFGKR